MVESAYTDYVRIKASLDLAFIGKSLVLINVADLTFFLELENSRFSDAAYHLNNIKDNEVLRSARDLYLLFLQYQGECCVSVVG